MDKKNLNLNNGLTIPIIGLGTGSYEKTEEIVYQSIKDGTRLIDTASAYKNEVEVGKGIKRAIDEGIIKREDLFVITKCGLNEKEDPEKALKASLERLNLPFVDLYLDHWPAGKKYNGKADFKLISIKEFWPKMESLVEKGLTKSIGVSNYNVQNILNILSICKIKPAANEVEFHPYLFQKDLKEFCEKEGIVVIGYNPMVKGAYCKEREEYIKERKLHFDLFNEEIVVNLAKKYGKTVGQIILNWHLHTGDIPIPSSSNPNRMKENLGAADFKMDESDYKEMNSFEEKGKQLRFCSGFGIYGIDIFA